MLKAIAQSCLVILVVGAAFAQTISTRDFPSDAVLQRIRVEGIRAHMQFLADDLLEGRGTGTRGYELAANYIRAQFEEMERSTQALCEMGTRWRNMLDLKSAQIRCRKRSISSAAISIRCPAGCSRDVPQ